MTWISRSNKVENVCTLDYYALFVKKLYLSNILFILY